MGNTSAPWSIITSRKAGPSYATKSRKACSSKALLSTRRAKSKPSARADGFDAPGEVKAVSPGRHDEVLAVQRLIADAKPVFEEQPLPLAYHAVAQIVQQQDLHGNAVGGCRFQIADIHPDTAITIDIDHQGAGTRQLGADSGGQAEAHGAHAARCQQAARMLECVILGRPHLVLTHARRDDRLPLRDFAEFLDDVLRLDGGAGPVVIHRVAAF